MKYSGNCVESIEARKKRLTTKYIQDQLSVKNMSDLTLKGKYGTKSLTKVKIRRNKWYGKEFIHFLNGEFVVKILRYQQKGITELQQRRLNSKRD